MTGRADPMANASTVPQDGGIASGRVMDDLWRKFFIWTSGNNTFNSFSLYLTLLCVSFVHNDVLRKENAGQKNFQRGQGKLTLA